MLLPLRAPPATRALGMLVAIATATACGPSSPKLTTMTHDDAPTKVDSPLAADAVAGVTDPDLAALLAEHWEWAMREAPTYATSLGDHRFDAELGSSSAPAIAARRATRRLFRDRAEALQQRGTLGDADAVTAALFVEELAAEIGTEVCENEQWAISASANPVGEFNYLAEMHHVVTPADGGNLVARFRAVPRAVDENIANLRAGLAAGRVTSRELARRTLEMVDAQLAKPVVEWSILSPLAAEATQKHVGWSADDEQRFATALRGAVDLVAAAYAKYRRVLAEEILPAARELEGSTGLPDGAACYRAAIRVHTALDLDPDAVHATGKSELARINDEMRALGKKLFGTDDLAAILGKLRTDATLFYTTHDEIVAAATASLAKARAAIPKWFGILPKTDCVVSVIPEYEAPFTTIAYYRQPHYDGSKPGEYFINTYKPEVRPRFEMEALTFHESIPGHHLQIAIAQELGALPAFRKFGGSTAYVEGWALYTERLADEMGLYGSDLDRMGMLSYDAWRASRLVVDTGLHHAGWTRVQAEAYMLEHTALTATNISNEVDRYISWPGQALAYKTGQMEIWKLRREAEAALGARFDIRAFHDVVLQRGAVTLPVLRASVERWIASRQDSPLR
jgi:uncharacterized protein (DUF885 family)